MKEITSIKELFYAHTLICLFICSKFMFEKAFDMTSSPNDLTKMLQSISFFECLKFREKVKKVTFII